MRSSASVVAAALALAACGGGPRGVGAAVLPGSHYGAYDLSGLASWYGEEAAGARTASGERFDPSGFTVAHRTLPLGSYVEVTAIDTGRTIVARVNDRGPGRRDRVIDLSRGAAQALGTDRMAVARVRVRAIVPGTQVDVVRYGDRITRASRPVESITVPTAIDGRYAVQVASFSNAARAGALATRIGGRVDPVGGLYRVRLGPFADAMTAQRARDAAAVRGYGDARILVEDR